MSVIDGLNWVWSNFWEQMTRKFKKNYLKLNEENGPTNEQGIIQQENVHHAEDLNEVEEWFDAVEVQEEDEGFSEN
ncbi:unnamed protein product [Allacma fusca]|uniref:Uncharacterized protein n=1 Tax=Allacma fusca TaxID=39272 RepID=A0A8J2NSV2_9HEXA|nr:unnamed protein product [Allacma fusca]